MGRVEKLFYRTCLRTLYGFESLQIPFTGIYGTSLVNWSLNSKESVRHWCETGVAGLNRLQGGFDHLSMSVVSFKTIFQETRWYTNTWVICRWDRLRE